MAKGKGFSKFIDKLPSLEKQFPKTIVKGSESPDITVIPSGSFVFDYLTNGGVPTNRITVFQGDKSSGKSTMLLRIIAMFLKMNPDKLAALVDYEHTYDKRWAYNFLGKDVDRIYVASPSFGEEGVDLMQALAESTDIGLIGIDSVGMITPTKEYENMAGEAVVGVHAKIINNMIRKLITGISERKKMDMPLTAIVLNQVRAMFGAGTFGPQTSNPGGKMLGHVNSLEVKFVRLGFVRAGKTNKATPIKSRHKIIVEKNKVGIPSRQGEYESYLIDYDDFPAGYIDESAEVVKYAKNADLVTYHGGKWSMFDREFKVKSELIQAVEDDLELREQIKEELRSLFKRSNLLGSPNPNSMGNGRR